MDLGDLAFRLILILLPGILATMLYRRLIVKKKWESIDIGLNTLLFGILSYLVLQAVYSVFKWGDLTIWKRLQDNQALPYNEIFWSTIWSIVIAVIAALIVNSNLINRIANILCITSKYGEENLFYTFLSQKETSEIHIKDPENNIIYSGYVKYYSEDEGIREFILEEVDLYEYNTAKHMSNVSKVYFSTPITNKLIIEIPKFTENAEA